MLVETAKKKNQTQASRIQVMLLAANDGEENHRSFPVS